MDFEEIQIKEEPGLLDSVFVKTEYELTEQEDPLPFNQNEYDEYLKNEIKTENSEDVVQFEITEISGHPSNYQHGDMGHKPWRSVEMNEHSLEKSEVFHCSYCWEIHKSKFSLTEHLMYHLYLMKNNFECKICYKRFNSTNRLKQHVKSFHSQNKKISSPPKRKGRPKKVVVEEPMKCPYCEKAIFKARTLENHMSTDHYGLPFDNINGPFTCTVCGEDYEVLNDLKKHVRKHTVKESYQCGFCKLILLTEKEIRDHADRYHKECKLPKRFPYIWKLVTCPYTGKTVPAREFILSRKSLICIFCEKVFLDPNSMKMHIADDHRGFSVNQTNGFFLCTICGQEYELLDDLEKHVIIHSSKETYECEFCKLRLLTKKEMVDHIVKHHHKPTSKPIMDYRRVKKAPLPKTNKCAYCDRKFVRNARLNNHISNVHYGLPLKPNSNGSFTCTVCGKNYEILDELKKHVRGHAIKESYQCAFCNQIVLTEREIYNHVDAYHHRSPLPDSFPLDWKLVTCPHTGKTIPAKSSRTFYKCPICPRIFSDTESVENHIQKHKKNYLKYECTVCHMAFPEEDNIALNHLKRHESYDPINNYSPFHLLKRIKNSKTAQASTDSPSSTSLLDQKPVLQNKKPIEDHESPNELKESSVNSVFQLLKKADDSKTDTNPTESSSSTVNLLEKKANANGLKDPNQIDNSINSLFHLLKKAQDAKKIIRNRYPLKSSSASGKS
ncbi:zinc finger protein 26-like isoform X2 [Phlebotomus papatasi]|nr:zinc finger protein 26-like isoform X2 [Phlebotomus papatasi]